MSELVIETHGLRKEFRTRRGDGGSPSQDLDLAVPAGGVHGFLGPNGSGKTTTIRMLLGLARATRGSMRLFGQPGARAACPTVDRPGRRRRRVAEVLPELHRPAEPAAAGPLHRRAGHAGSTPRSRRSG